MGKKPCADRWEIWFFWHDFVSVTTSARSEKNVKKGPILVPIRTSVFGTFQTDRVSSGKDVEIFKKTSIFGSKPGGRTPQKSENPIRIFLSILLTIFDFWGFSTILSWFLAEKRHFLSSENRKKTSKNGHFSQKTPLLPLGSIFDDFC